MKCHAGVEFESGKPCPRCNAKLGEVCWPGINADLIEVVELRKEVANFRVLLDGLFHSMPMTPEMPQHVKDYLTNLSRLVYIEGKEGVMRAREVVNGAVSTPPGSGK